MEDDGAALPSDSQLSEFASCGLLLTRPDGAIVKANTTFCRWLGYDAAELVGRRRLQDLLTMGGRIFHQTHWAPLMQIQGSVAEVKVEMCRRDGHRLPMMMNALRIEHAGRTYHQVSVFVAEDRHRYEHELLLARQKAEVLLQKEREVALFAEQMIGIVSHDLRNPLTAIEVGAHLLRRGELTPQQQSVLGRIVNSSHRAHRLIADLLDFTAARVGRGLAMHPASVDLHELVGEHLVELSTSFPDIRLVHQKEGEGRADVDADRLAQLIGNLVGNAVVYGDPAQPVTATSIVRPDEVAVCVHNFGTPIPEDLQQRLFEPMVRGTSATRTQRSVGLGLFIVREIARGHGGDIRVSSSAVEGTTFCATFPRYAAADRVRQPQQP
ncbi:PAS domain-containing sensor histidine kinase [Piscinibacter sp. HJYY11]|uniref:PAS domain-containing sensor histidine kinase n=1 Tax=Piscinibacter sp. HJYY11 TaxID=2801333 RepID=UPI00191E7A73|nr:PAS domain-containing sensor histidine kinase [Piscinibacter sp. HJYY11]MBL0730064.1 PAS domain-containing sensor histidine kinase [Piscinibacter sp. HJYY11]